MSDNRRRALVLQATRKKEAGRRELLIESMRKLHHLLGEELPKVGADETRSVTLDVDRFNEFARRVSAAAYGHAGALDALREMGE